MLPTRLTVLLLLAGLLVWAVVFALASIPWPVADWLPDLTSLTWMVLGYDLCIVALFASDALADYGSAPLRLRATRPLPASRSVQRTKSCCTWTMEDADDGRSSFATHLRRSFRFGRSSSKAQCPPTAGFAWRTNCCRPSAATSASATCTCAAAGRSAWRGSTAPSPRRRRCRSIPTCWKCAATRRWCARRWSGPAATARSACRGRAASSATTATTPPTTTIARSTGRPPPAAASRSPPSTRANTARTSSSASTSAA